MGKSRGTSHIPRLDKIEMTGTKENEYSNIFNDTDGFFAA